MIVMDNVLLTTYMLKFSYTFLLTSILLISILSFSSCELLEELDPREHMVHSGVM